MRDVGTVIDEVFQKCVKAADLYEPLHRCGYQAVRKVVDNMTFELVMEDIDLSFKFCITPAGIVVGGNRSAVASNYVRTMFKREWKIVDEQAVEDVFRNAKGFFKSKYGTAAEPTSEEAAWSCVSRGHRFDEHGIGSCWSAVETDVKVYTDSDGYVLVEQTTMVWD